MSCSTWNQLHQEVIAQHDLYDRFESNIRGRKSLGIDSTAYGSLISPILFGKVQSDVRLVISREPEEDLILDALLENVELEVVHVATEPAGASPIQVSDSNIPTVATLSTTCSSNQGSPQMLLLPTRTLLHHLQARYEY